MGTYDRQIATALKLIREKGRPVNIAREGHSTYDPATQQAASTGMTNLTLQGVTTPATQGKIESFEITFADRETLVSRELRFLICAASGATFRPKESDVVTIDGDDFHILGTTRVSINGEDIIYRFGVYR